MVQWKIGVGFERLTTMGETIFDLSTRVNFANLFFFFSPIYQKKMRETWWDTILELPPPTNPLKNPITTSLGRSPFSLDLFVKGDSFTDSRDPWDENHHEANHHLGDFFLGVHFFRANLRKYQEVGSTPHPGCQDDALQFHDKNKDRKRQPNQRQQKELVN